MSEAVADARAVTAAPEGTTAVAAPARAATVAAAEAPVLIEFEQVGKAFRRFEHQPFLLRNLMLRLVGKAKAPTEFWPLREVSFTIRQGETVGVIGRNGSGKSTLLRMIAGACYPTEGKIKVRGRIAPLLSLGVGFHPDMTGRECLEINAAAIGLTAEEIRHGVGPIADFAEIGEFLETPVRYYSSGMLARLGFSVAVHATPDLLLVDEALSVGDHTFQRKCMDRIAEMKRAGTTIFFVSHSADAVRGLCDRAMWLRDGHLVADGEAGPILDAYMHETR